MAVDANQNETKIQINYAAECEALLVEARLFRADGAPENEITDFIGNGLRRLAKQLSFMGKPVLVDTSMYLCAGTDIYRVHANGGSICGIARGFRYDPAIGDEVLGESLQIQLIVEREAATPALIPAGVPHDLVAI